MSADEIELLRGRLVGDANSPHASRWRHRLSVLLAEAGSTQAALLEACRAFALRRSASDTGSQLLRMADLSGVTEALRRRFREVVNGRSLESSFHESELLPELSDEDRFNVALWIFQYDDAPSHIQAVPGESAIFAAGVKVDSRAFVWPDNAVTRKVIPFQTELLKNKKIEIVSPFSGMTINSTASLVVSNGRPVIFYYFSDIEPFFVLINPFSGAKEAVFFPNDNITISTKSTRYGINIAYLKALALRFAAPTTAYLRSARSRKLALLTGTIHHWGHNFLNEYEACIQCEKQGLLEAVDVVLSGWCNFLPLTEYLPSVGCKDVIRAENIVELYQAVLEGDLLVVRPTTGYWVSRALREKISAAVIGFKERNQLRRLSEAETHWPLIWFELRLNDRIWLNQAEAIPIIARSLKEIYPSLAIVLAGWSRMEDYNVADEQMIEKDVAVARTVELALSDDIKVFNIAGCRTIEKIAWGMAVDTFAATAGTGLVFPYVIGQAVGVVHANAGLAESLWGRRKARKLLHIPLGEYSDSALEIDWPFIEQPGPLIAIRSGSIVDENANEHFHTRDYFIDPELVVGLLKKILEVVKPRNRKATKNSDTSAR